MSRIKTTEEKRKEEYALKEQKEKINKEPAYAEIILSLSERAKDNGLIAEERGVKPQTTFKQLKNLVEIGYVSKKETKYEINYANLIKYWQKEFPELVELNKLNASYLLMISKKMIENLRFPTTIEALGQTFVWIFEQKNNPSELHTITDMLLAEPKETQNVVFDLVANAYKKKNPEKIKKAKQMNKKMLKKLR